ncbi:MAG TPA: hypothetical protein P5164_13810 [Thermoanaerobaculia bacterium]|nr:hypothetical protein [Thermoanaerobaculia bacterium]
MPLAGARLRSVVIGLAIAAAPLRAFGAEGAPETPPPAEAPETRQGGTGRELSAVLRELSLSGFFDVTARDRRSEENVFAMGDFELDLARELGSSVQVAAALVVNDDGAALAVGFLDVHLLGGLVAPRGRLPVEKGLHVQLGRFDVPFGNDWQLYATKDRVEASAPLTTEELLDGGVNDVGLRVLGSDGTFGYTAYALRGEGSGNAFGGRVSIAPLDVPFRFPPRLGLVEVGVSLLHDADDDGKTERTALALDAQTRSGPLSVRGEYVRIDARPTEESPVRSVRDGWHVTAAFEAGDLPGGVSLTPYARYDTVRGDEGTAEGSGRTVRVTGGANAALFARLTLKAEYRRTLEAPEAIRAAEGFGRDAWLVQAVVTF